MSKRVVAGTLNAAALLLAASLLAPLQTAQSQTPDQSKGTTTEGGGLYGSFEVPIGPPPKFADGTPDLSGLWLGSGSNSADISSRRGLKEGDEVVMLPWAEEVVANRLSQEDPQANCLPSGVPRGSPYPWRLVQNPGIYYILYEGNIHSFRQIFMDAEHPEDPDPTWFGHSVGHWEGDTLVVDTIGYNDKFWFDYKGHPHTEQLRTIERFTRTDMGHMALEVTIEDPGTYTKPFTTLGRATLMPGELLEYICQENNQDLELLEGPARGPGLQ